MNTHSSDRSDGSCDRRMLPTAPQRADIIRDTDGVIARLRLCRDQLSAARTDLAEAIAACGWATRRYESAATRAQSAATAWSHTHGRWQATSRALRRQFVDAVTVAERLRKERLEVSTAAKALRSEIELIEHEMVALAQQIGSLVESELGEQGNLTA
ncbi:MAG TPA: hypothetical protein VNA88_05370 [Candidatus Kapabacteria bacterium]|nr:hypothetical protein [Candidatus Kapabacteria bacterium]